jgi:signal transduction histidine kinase
MVLSSTGLADEPYPAPKRILLVHHYGREIPAVVLFDKGFEQVLKSVPPGSIELYRETLEAYRFPGEQHEQLMRKYLKEKYADRKFDVVVAYADTSLEFVTRYREELFPGVPVVYIVSKRPEPGTEPPLSTGVWVGPNIKETLEVALELQPETDHVFVISGPLNNNRMVEVEAQDQLREFESRLRLTYVMDRPLDEVIEMVRSLPERSIVLCQRQTRGVGGRSIIPRDAVTLIAKAANVPVYGTFDIWIGEGIVGGRVVSHENVGKRAAQMTLSIADGARPEEIPAETGSLIPMFDGRQLRRWGISEKRLPADSTVLYQQRSFWELYRWRIAITIAGLLAETLLIAALLVQRSRRARAERARKASEEKLQKLSGRLLQLQDEEQRRIAAELHDGLGQSLSIIRNRATLCKEDVSNRDNVVEQLDEISATAVSALDEVREIAHNLRPYELERLGLVSAVDSMLERVSDATSIHFYSDLDQIDGLLSPAAEMSVYRIVQEGLNNVIRHAQASEARVDLKRSESEIVVSIQDNGKGIVSAVASSNGQTGSGFGLHGIAERARMLGGVSSLESRPGSGTRLVVRLAIKDETNGKKTAHSNRR